MKQDTVLDWYGSASECYNANDNKYWDQEGVDFKSGLYNDVVVDASWAVPLDDENRQPRLCISDAHMSTDYDTYYDYFYCTSVPGDCGLSFAEVCFYF